MRLSLLKRIALFSFTAASGVALVVRPPVVVSAALSLLLVMLLSLLVRLLATSPGGSHQQPLLRWTIAAFLVHLAVGVAVTLLTTAWQYLGPDAGQYHNDAAEIVENWKGQASAPLLPPGKEGFYYLLAGLYSLFGTNMVFGLIVNAAFAAALVPLLADTTKRLFGGDASNRVPPLALLLPSFLLWPSQLLREAGILFFLAVAANCATRLARSTTPLTVAFFIVSVTLLFTFRGYIALIAGAALLAGVVISRQEVVAGIGAGMSLAIVLGFVVFSLGIGYSGYRATTQTSLESANLIRLDSSKAATSGFDEDADISTSRRALGYLPVGFTRLALGPFPWEVRTIRHLPALADALSIWVLFPALIAGGGVARRKSARTFAALVVPPLAVAMTVSLLIGNFGTIVRSRTQVMVLITPLLAAGLADRSKRRQERRRGSVSLPEGRLVTR